MSQRNLESKFTIVRTTQERRAEPRTAPPYLTDEGFVLIDRRENVDRRFLQPQSAQDNTRQRISASNVVMDMHMSFC